MKKNYFILLFTFIAVNVFAQQNVTVHVKDGVSNLPIQGVAVTANSQTLATNTNGDVTFILPSNANYPYSTSQLCYAPSNGTLTVVNQDFTENVSLTALATAYAFFDIFDFGVSPMLGTPTGSHPKITIKQGASTIDSFTYDYAEFFDNFGPANGNVRSNMELPFGSYTYEITPGTGECFKKVTGSFTLDCAKLDANNPESVASTQVILKPTLATAYAFFDIFDFGVSPMLGTPTGSHPKITIKQGASTIDSFTYDYAEFFDNFGPANGNVRSNMELPFGSYTYEITPGTGECFKKVTGSFTLDCAKLDANNPESVASTQVNLNPTIVIDVIVTQNTNELTANAIGSTISYQWVDCNNGKAPIAGATNQIFTATTNGSYAVIITDSNCSNSETSSCYVINSLGLSKKESPLSLKLYPNPVLDELTIQLSNSYDKIEIQVYSMLGQLLNTVRITNSAEYRLNLSGLSSGSYLVKIDADGKTNASVILKK